MNARLIKFWNDLQSSYYFIPGLMVLGAILLAYGTTEIDRNIEYALAKNLSWFHSNKADGARAILTTIASSMMTVAAVTFSITMVAVTTAAGQYGPRLIGNFMRDRANQITLGTFTSTFVYCLLILRVARTGDSADVENAVTEFVPNVSLLIAMVLTLISVGVMIFFIHHVPETLNVGNITGQVGRKLRREIETLFPGKIGDGEESEETPELGLDEKMFFDLKAKAEGYIQAVDDVGIMDWATKYDVIIHLQYRPGDFAVKGNRLMRVWINSPRDEPISKEALKDLRNKYAMGQDRTSHQNILFLADELVEILARALSPGVNDPFTAINCINWYQSAITAMQSANIPGSHRLDDDGNVRVIAHPISFKRFISVLCDQSLPYIAADRNVSVKMLTVLTELTASAKTPEQREILEDQIENLKRATHDRLGSDHERDDLRQRFAKSTRMISDPDYYEEVVSSEGWGGGRA